MKLEEIRRILVTTGPPDWHQIEGFPTYRDNLAALVDDGPIEGHHHIAAYKADVRLTIAWGMDPPGDDNPHDPESGWATWWRERGRIDSFLVDVFFCNALVDRHFGAWVDQTVSLPYPSPHAFSKVFGEGPIGWTVTRWQVELFRLIHGLAGSAANYDTYLGMARFAIDDSDE